MLEMQININNAYFIFTLRLAKKIKRINDIKF